MQRPQRIIRRRAGPLVALALLLARGQVAGESVGTDQRERLHLTLYGSGSALVTDVRRVHVPAGRSEIEFPSIAWSIDASSVVLGAAGGGADPRILEQRVRAQGVDRASLLREWLGRDIRLLQVLPDGQTSPRTVRLLAYEPNLLVEAAGQLEIDPPGVIALGAAPVPRLEPSIAWSLDSAGDVRQLQVSYLAGNLNWQAEHHLVLARSEDQVSWRAMVTLENNSRTDFPRAEVDLIAGDVNRVGPAQPVMEMAGVAMSRMLKADAGAPDLPQSPLFEYHRYSVPDRVDLEHMRPLQVPLFQRDQAEAAVELRIEGAPGIFGRQPELQPMNAQVTLLLHNSAAQGLGLPVPAGRVRVYQRDDRGDLQLLGEDRVQHTAVDGTVRLQLGQSFDVSAERRQTAYRQRGERLAESSYEIVVRNSKPEAQAVKVIEHLSGDWQILAESHPHELLDAGTIAYAVKVEPGKVVRLTYTVQSSW